MAEVVIVVETTAYLFISAIVTASILLFVALFWATCSPGRGMKVALAAAAACLVASTAWTFATLL